MHTYKANNVADFTRECSDQDIQTETHKRKAE